MPSNRLQQAKRRRNSANLRVSSRSNILDQRIIWRPIDALIINARNSRRHSRAQISKLARSIETLGIFLPIVIDESRVILAGHGRLEAARLLNMLEVPTLLATGLTEAEKRAFMLADNRIAEQASWDRDMLRTEFKELIVLDLDLELSGFDTGEIDIMIDGPASSVETAEVAPSVPSGPPVSRPGDLWQLGKHRLLCGDATKVESYVILLGGRKAHMVFTDPPYNVRIGRNVSGLGKVSHREFQMASGEMSKGQFTRFLTAVLGHLADNTERASIHFHCMDWRHLGEILSAGEEVYSDLKNICVWKKDNAGMGSFYRSQHELVLVFQNGAGKFTNNINLGATGRYRTNVWEYPGMASMGADRMASLEMHPTVKPVALVADAIRDASKRNDLILDPFSGSGTTIIAAERTGRAAVAMEIDPAYVDVTIARWQKATSEAALLEATGETFAYVATARTIASSNNVAAE